MIDLKEDLEEIREWCRKGRGFPWDQILFELRPLYHFGPEVIESLRYDIDALEGFLGLYEKHQKEKGE
jgi:hypothetical protein